MASSGKRSGRGEDDNEGRVGKDKTRGGGRGQKEDKRKRKDIVEERGS